jgi:hypothetical protein
MPYNEGMEETKRIRSVPKAWLLNGIGVCALLLAIIGLLTWQLLKPAPLLPKSLTSQVTTFTPYFYTGKIPAGYTLDTAHASYSQGVLMLPLTKNGSPTVILAEQYGTQIKNLHEGGDKVENTNDPASINSVEGRMVGVMDASAHHTLIIFNAPSGVDKDDLTALLQALKPLR